MKTLLFGFTLIIPSLFVPPVQAGSATLEDLYRLFDAEDLAIVRDSFPGLS